MIIIIIMANVFILECWSHNIDFIHVRQQALTIRDTGLLKHGFEGLVGLRKRWTLCRVPLPTWHEHQNIPSVCTSMLQLMLRSTVYKAYLIGKLLKNCPCCGLAVTDKILKKQTSPLNYHQRSLEYSILFFIKSILGKKR